MNSITRETIEREIKHEQDRFNRWNEDIDRYRADLNRLERQRDEIGDRIGALKEDLAHAERADARQKHLDALARTFA